MSLNKAFHEIKEIGGVRCSVVETGLSKERFDFLKSILEFNKQEVVFEEAAAKNEGDKTTFNLGVKDVSFNAIMSVYQRKLRTKDMHKVTADYWNQKSTVTEPNYWALDKK